MQYNYYLTSIFQLEGSNIFCGATSKLITVLGSKEQNGKPFIAPHASPEISEIEHSAIMYQRTGIYRLHSISNCSESVNSTTQVLLLRFEESIKSVY